MKLSSLLVRFTVTCVAVIIAGLIAWQLWCYYMDSPWTRDGRVRADIVSLAPDVSGPVVKVFVHDNETVQKGEPLFQVDPSRFNLALAAAKASLAQAQATMTNTRQNAQRYLSLSSNAASAMARENAESAAQEAKAAYELAQANLGVAELNLERTTVRATVNGQVTNFSMRPGDYVRVGTPVIAIVDTDTLYIDGYFEETKFRNIAIGDAARIQLMQGGPVIEGHVQGISAAIANAETAGTTSLLANVNPTFTWVRLAARIPVRITPDKIPPGLKLVAGMTCTVTIIPKSSHELMIKKIF